MVVGSLDLGNRFEVGDEHAMSGAEIRRLFFAKNRDLGAMGSY
jgi:hypothetical protein